jgi:DNA-binding MarR family transcriptional regulator
MTAAAADMAAAIRILLRTFTINEARFPPAEGRLSYNGADFQAIHFIGDRQGCSAQDLATHLGVVATTAQSVIDRLVERGIVARNRNPADGRSVALSLTAKGRELREAIERQDVANCARMLGALPQSDAERFVTSLRQIADSIAEDR